MALTQTIMHERFLTDIRYIPMFINNEKKNKNEIIQ